MSELVDKLKGTGAILYCPRCGNAETAANDCEFCNHGDGGAEKIAQSLDEIFNPKPKVVPEVKTKKKK